MDAGRPRVGDKESQTQTHSERQKQGDQQGRSGNRASGLAAPARLAETHIPSWGFRWKPSSPTGALPHFELQLKTS